MKVSLKKGEIEFVRSFSSRVSARWKINFARACFSLDCKPEQSEKKIERETERRQRETYSFKSRYILRAKR